MRWAALALVGCVHATPVTPAPASAAEIETMRAALVSHSWESRRWHAPGEDWQSDRVPTQFVFGQRHATIRAVGGYGYCVRCPYTLEGRNVRIRRYEGGELTFRVDASEPGRLELFWYDLSRSFDLTPTSHGPP